MNETHQICSTLRMSHGTRHVNMRTSLIRFVAHMNESCHNAQYHAYEWVMSHLKETRHICGTLGTYSLPRLSVSCHIRTNHITYEWVMSSIGMGSRCIEMRHVMYEQVMSHIWMSHVTYERDTSHMWQTWHLFTVSSLCVMSQIWISHVKRMPESSTQNCDNHTLFGWGPHNV